MTNEQPLIWTSKGNLPVADLTYVPMWEETDDYIKFVETYKLDNEVVKQSAYEAVFGSIVVDSPTDCLGNDCDLQRMKPEVLEIKLRFQPVTQVVNRR